MKYYPNIIKQLLILSTLLYSCTKNGNIGEKTVDNFQIKTSKSIIKNNFIKAKTIADTIAQKLIAPEKLGNFHCEYHFEYYDEQKYNNDSINKPPTDYHISYYLIYNGDTIGNSPISIDSSFQVKYCRINSFIGQRHFWPAPGL